MLLTKYKQKCQNLQDSLSKDFLAGASVYDLMLKRSAVIDTFEKYGFIWGRKWYHYDAMHFEYRPELL